MSRSPWNSRTLCLQDQVFLPEMEKLVPHLLVLEFDILEIEIARPDGFQPADGAGRRLPTGKKTVNRTFSK